MLKANVDIWIFQEMKVTKGFYKRELSAYRAVDSEAPIAHNSGVAVLFCASYHFSV